MLENILRPKLQTGYIDPLAKLLYYRLDLNADKITALAFLFGFLTCISLYFKLAGVAFIFLLISGLLDVVDGTVARFDAANHYGAVLDISVDRVVEFFIILGLFLFNPATRGLSCILMLGAVLICVTSFLVVSLMRNLSPGTNTKSSNKAFEYSPGLMERCEAFMMFSLMIILPSMFNILALTFTVLVTFTGIYRVYEYIYFSEN